MFILGNHKMYISKWSKTHDHGQSRIRLVIVESDEIRESPWVSNHIYKVFLKSCIALIRISRM